MGLEEFVKHSVHSIRLNCRSKRVGERRGPAAKRVFARSPGVENSGKRRLGYIVGSSGIWWGGEMQTWRAGRRCRRAGKQRRRQFVKSAPTWSLRAMWRLKLAANHSYLETALSDSTSDLSENAFSRNEFIRDNLTNMTFTLSKSL